VSNHALDLRTLRLSSRDVPLHLVHDVHLIQLLAEHCLSCRDLLSDPAAEGDGFKRTEDDRFVLEASELGGKVFAGLLLLPGENALLPPRKRSSLVVRHPTNDRTSDQLLSQVPLKHCIIPYAEALPHLPKPSPIHELVHNLEGDRLGMPDSYVSEKGRSPVGEEACLFSTLS
jgi:hypothetical protein